MQKIAKHKYVVVIVPFVSPFFNSSGRTTKAICTLAQLLPPDL